MENLIHHNFRSGTDNPNEKTYYYLIKGNLFSCLNEVPYKAKETSSQNLNESNERWHKIYYNEWEVKLKKIDIRDSELEKVKNKVYDFENCAWDAPPIDVTEIIDSTYDNEHGIDIYFFKQIDSIECEDLKMEDYDNSDYKGDISIDRLVGWFRKRVSIKDHEVDYLKFVMREYNSLNKK